jgi:hypothetical protein
MIIGGVVPQVTRLTFNRVWASIFDRANLVVVRMVLAVFLGLGIVVYFATELVPVVIIGQVILNVAFSGGPIFWHLWVTRVAPKGQVSTYMSVHSFMTGIRGTLAPFVGFLAVAGLSFRVVGLLSGAAIALAIVLLAPLRKDPRTRPPGG